MDSGQPNSLPITEQENPRTRHLSDLPIAEILRVMNSEDELVARAVQLVLPAIETAVNGIVARLSKGGRLFYAGTGTSGRLGVLDAAECPPTFGVPPELVQALIAGGYEACHRAVEASEDNAQAGANDLQSRGFRADDALVGISASGQTPYTVGALQHARSLAAFTIALTCVPDSPLTKVADISIVPVVGPEVIAGSTRLKAGSAQKMILNMLSTATLAKLRYVSGNRMTNLRASNAKLQERALRIIMAEAGVSREDAIKSLSAAEGDVRVALLTLRNGCTAAVAKNALKLTDGLLPQAIKLLNGRR